ncbi:MAG TPA: class I SAM-dependent methyltransferase [Gammaproteobacteria bacterium]
MASAKQHYEELLSDIYSWMFGGLERGVERNAAFFDRLGIRPRGSGTAFDLGAGCGFQSIPLARLGFAVTAVDLDQKLLQELVAHAGPHSVSTVQDDLLEFDRYAEGPVELVVCMTDTILHLESKHDVRRLFRKVYAALEPGGRFIVTFRDLSQELVDLDRFLLVRADDTTILTCFLEYEPGSVKVHDLVHRKQDGAWHLHKSYYRKLRLSRDWVTSELLAAGFADLDVDVMEGGMIAAVATR